MSDYRINATIKRSSGSELIEKEFPINDKVMSDVCQKLGSPRGDGNDCCVSYWELETNDMVISESADSADINEMNYFAGLVREMSDAEVETLAAVIALSKSLGIGESLEDSSGYIPAKNLINLAIEVRDDSSYELRTDIKDYDDYGRERFDDFVSIDEDDREFIDSYFDYEAFGESVGNDDGVVFLDEGEGCLIAPNGLEISNDYTGAKDIPDKYRVTGKKNAKTL